jgi:hypothetical protein
VAGRLRGGAVAALLAPLAWIVVLFALAGPLALSSHAAPPTSAAAGGAASHAQAAPATGMEDPDGGDTDRSPGVLGLPPKVHLIVNRTGTGTAPPAPVLTVLPAPVDRTDAGIRIASEQAGAPPADALPRNSLWGRAPPRASA